MTTATPFDFSAVTSGCLPLGTETAFGVVAQASLTAYRCESNGASRWVPFDRLHGAPKPVEPLVFFA